MEILHFLQNICKFHCHYFFMAIYSRRTLNVLKKNYLTVSIILAISGVGYANEISLETITVDGNTPSTKGKLLGGELNSNESVVDEKN